ncbi:MAG: PBP1A family penicillin-binding protein [Myxococcota bacterium]|nr:PBP1A family penicillin-binding protein [Myxococcota bacterium]
MARRKPAGRSQKRRARTRRQPRRRLGLRRALALSLGIVAFGGGVLAGRTLVRLDRVVVSRFEGRLFRVPSRVFSAPTILYPGLDVERADLRETLRRLGYRQEQSPEVLAPGGMHWSGSRAFIHLRAFEHPTRPEPARRIGLRFADGHIESIRDLHGRRELSAVLLEPELVGAYYGPQREQRELVRLTELPPHLPEAVLAVEDQRFQGHRGIDLRRVAGAMWANVRAGGIRQGGSTVTQQLVKNFFLTPERTFERKLQEAAMALLVEARYEKEAILEAYLNEIYLGQRGSTAIHGMGEAARFYFGKSARTLSLDESALLAALIQSPGGHSPFRDPERARERRDLVLGLMLRQGRIGEESHDFALARPLRLASRTGEPRETRYFLDALRRQLPELYDREVLASEGMSVYSTLDLRLQRRAAEALRDGLEEVERTYPALKREGAERLQGCVVALRPQTGEVLALVGGREYGASQYDRCTQARRPAGSVFKPFVYVAALEPAKGGPAITLGSRLDDGPLTVRTPAGPWKPANYDREHHGVVSVREALERSLNVATARLGQQVGIDRVLEMARRLGISSELRPVPSLALGAADLSPLELARAYATLVNGGIRPELRTFEDLVDAEGQALEQRSIAFERVLDPATSYLAVSLLEGVVERGTASGLRRAGLTGPIAGKTGTSDDARDVWFVGFTPELVAVVWVGFDEPRSMKYPASRIAVPIWRRFIQAATGGHIRGRFVRPPGVRMVDIDPRTGALALSRCPRRESELFIEGTEPSHTCPEGVAARDRDDEQGVLERFEKWLGRIL